MCLMFVLDSTHNSTIRFTLSGHFILYCSDQILYLNRRSFIFTTQRLSSRTIHCSSQTGYLRGMYISHCMFSGQPGRDKVKQFERVYRTYVHRDLLLSGSEHISVDKNTRLFEAAFKCISESKRFCN